ncbi:MAG: hypothetical protein CBB66_00640 [bacterium TMED6]|nr:MAG: hypothetical protein CBB66_00640 [bacterium TMED6]
MRYIIIFFTIITLSISNECPGDVNIDNSINIQDIILISNHTLNLNSLEDEGLINADINNDGIINILDIISVVNLILNNLVFCEDSIIDLSLDWEIEEDLSYFDYYQLENILNTEISELSSIEGIVIIHKGKIISENYFNDSSISDTFNIQSVTKSFISTLIGQAIDRGILNFEDTLNITFGYPDIHLENLTLENLLTMSSGYSDYYVYPEWIYVDLNELVTMPVINQGGFWYNNSSCHLNAHIIYETTGQTPIEFANSNLFPFLGIINPFWLDGNNDINDGSSSIWLTLREMVKLGQLYNQNGYASSNNQIISSEYIDKATSNLIETGWSYYGFENLDGYGYLWWIPQEGYLAYGYGGQFIAVFPERDLVIGTHSETFSETAYQIELLNIIYNQIAPLFNN